MAESESLSLNLNDNLSPGLNKITQSYREMNKQADLLAKKFLEQNLATKTLMKGIEGLNAGQTGSVQSALNLAKSYGKLQKDVTWAAKSIKEYDLALNTSKKNTLAASAANKHLAVSIKSIYRLQKPQQHSTPRTNQDVTKKALADISRRELANEKAKTKETGKQSALLKQLIATRIAGLQAERTARAQIAAATSALASKEHALLKANIQERIRALQAERTAKKQIAAAGIAAANKERALLKANMRERIRALQAERTAKKQIAAAGVAAAHKERALLKETLKYRIRALQAERKLRGLQAQTNKGAQSYLLTWQSVARILAGQIIRDAFFGMTSQLREGFDAAVQYGKAISEIRTLSQGNQLATAQWKSELLDISSAYGFDALDAAEAAYEALSNQVAEGANTFKFLEASQRLALATVSDLTVAQNALAATINAYGIEVNQADKLSAQFFKAVDVGRFRLDQISDTFGNAAILASKLGISTEELLGALSALTIQGVTPSQAMTQLRGIMVKLIKPTGDMSALLSDLGFESGESATRAIGLAGVLKEISDASKGSYTELAKLIPRIRGLTGAAAFSGEGFDILLDSIERIKDGAAEFENAVAITLESTAKKFEIEMAQVDRVFLETGDTMLEFVVAFNTATSKVGGLSGALKLALSVLTTVAIPGIAILSAGMVKLSVNALRATGAIGKLGKVASIARVGALGLYGVLAVLAAKTILYAQHNSELNRSLRLMEHRLQAALLTAEELEQAVGHLTDRLNDGLATVIENQAKDVMKEFNESLGTLEDNLVRIDAAFETTAETIDKSFTDALKNSENALKNNVTAKAQLIDQMGKIDDLASNATNKLTDKTPENAFSELLNQIKDASAKFASTDDPAKVLKEIIRLTAEADSIAKDQVKLAEENTEALAAAEQKKIKKLEALNTKRREFAIEEAANKRKAKLLGRTDRLGAKELTKQIKVDREEFDIKDRTGRGRANAEFTQVRDGLIAARRFEIESVDIIKTAKELAEDRVKVLQEQNHKARLSHEQEILEIREQQSKIEAARAEIGFAEAKLERTLEGDDLGASKEAGAERLAAFEELSKLVSDTGRTDEGAAITKKALADAALLGVELEKKALQRDKTEIIQAYANLTSQAKVLQEHISELDRVTKASGLGSDSPSAKKSDQLFELRQKLLADAKAIAAEHNFIIDATEDASKGAANAIAKTLKLMEEAYYRMEDAQIAYNATLDAAANAPVPVNKAAGGLLQHGQDVIPAMLSPGEFVLNKQATNQMYSQLVSANNGTNFASGGSTTNVGDISVTLQTSGNEALDARAIGHALNREIRRGTLSLR